MNGPQRTAVSRRVSHISHTRNGKRSHNLMWWCQKSEFVAEFITGSGTQSHTRNYTVPMPVTGNHNRNRYLKS